MDAVICHGGHNTTTEALSNALPLVVCPIKDDQPVVAQQVADSGCGLRLSFTRPRPAHLAEAVDRVLNEASFKEAAASIAESFAAAGGPARAADHLEALVGVTK
jgi:UDP:flavonoid glycosyltransferase YjiC (YdhE family)